MIPGSCSPRFMFQLTTRIYIRTSRNLRFLNERSRLDLLCMAHLASRAKGEQV